MSHFTRVQTQIRELDCLLEALRLMGYDKVETGKDLHLQGYHGDDRSKLRKNDPNYAPPCQVVIRRKYVSSSANDIGFFKKPDGTYELYLSEYDRDNMPHWAERLTQLYGLAVVIKYSTMKGYKPIHQEKQKDGTIRLMLRKW